MRLRGLIALSFLGALVCLSSCGGGSNLARRAAVLNGNWHLTGAEDFGYLPTFSIAVGVEGNNIYGSADVFFQCESGSGIGSAPVGFTGQIAPDGSFQMANDSRDTTQIVIKGKVPQPGATTWSGSYTATTPASDKDCVLNQTTQFSATAFAPLKGSYQGKITGDGLGSGIQVSTTITQEQFTVTTTGALVRYATPLSATLDVTGASCLSSGSTLTDENATGASAVSGSVFDLAFVMKDGSNLVLFGWFTDASQTTLQVQNMSNFGGTCGTIHGGGTLTRQ